MGTFSQEIITFFQYLANGLTMGSLYALVALGYTMVYGIMKLINFAHGDLVILSSFIGLTIYSYFVGINVNSLMSLFLMFSCTAIFIACVGVLIEKLAYKPLRTAPRLSAVVSALGAGMVIQNSVMLIWGPNASFYPANIFPQKIWVIAGVTITFMDFVILGLSAILMAFLILFINKTKIGTAIRAVAIDQDAAKLMGINVNRVIMYVFIIGSALGSIAGLLIGMKYTGISFHMGWTYALPAFVAAIIGGIGSIPGAVIGGLLLGIFNEIISGYISASWSQTFTFTLLILILIFRPRGILGEKIAEKV